jgi:hypothetical protein
MTAKSRGMRRASSMAKSNSALRTHHALFLFSAATSRWPMQIDPRVLAAR